MATLFGVRHGPVRPRCCCDQLIQCQHYRPVGDVHFGFKTIGRVRSSPPPGGLWPIRGRCDVKHGMHLVLRRCYDDLHPPHRQGVRNGSLQWRGWIFLSGGLWSGIHLREIPNYVLAKPGGPVLQWRHQRHSGSGPLEPDSEQLDSFAVHISTVQ